MLDNDVFEFDDCVFLGTTLWSNFELNVKEKELSKNAAKFAICDFSTIFKNKKTLTPDDMECLNKESVSFLEKNLLKYKNKKTIVISHFAPFTGSINEAYRHEASQAYFVNNFDDKFGGLADYWIHGHTHSSYNYNVHGTNVICNPRGASRLFNIDSNVNFKRDYILDVSRDFNLSPGSPKKGM